MSRDVGCSLIPGDIGCGANPANWTESMVRGVMTANLTSRFSEITDGTSQTIMVLEIRAGVAPVDPRGVWDGSPTITSTASAVPAARA